MNPRRNADGSLTITSPNGVATISPTPDAGVASARPFTLHINRTFQDTYDAEEDAISAAYEILSHKP